MTDSKLYFVEREFDVAIDTLWSAWTSVSALEQWYSPTDLSVLPDSAISENFVGGRWAIGVDVTAHGFNAYFWGRYSQVEQNKKLVHTLCYSQDPQEFEALDDDVPAHTIVVDFEERNGKSWCKFTQLGEMPQDQAEMSRQGMISYFDNLEKFLAK
jgi:uncharacterized protein YndB with AHSA1/START domain